MSKKKTAKKAGTTTARRKKSKPAEAAPEAAAPPKPEKVDITAAKGRPMLTWVGKRPLAHVTAFPAQLVERHDALRIVGIDPQNIDAHDEKMQLFSDLRSQCNEECWKDAPFINGVWAPEIGGVLLHGDNKDILAFLLANGYRGKVNLIYIDPPFDSGADYIRRVTLRGQQAAAQMEGEAHGLGEQIQYTDIWTNDNYLQYMYERLILLKEMLASNGAFYLHCDPRRSALLRIVMDEVFGSDNFQNEIVWERTNAHNMPTKTFVRSHDVLLMYTKSDEFKYIKQYGEYSEAQIERYKPDEQGRLYTGRDLTFSTKNPERQFEWRGTRPPGNRSWGYSKEDLERLWSEGRILTKKDGTPRLDGLKVYLDETKGKPLTTIWTDINRIGNTSSERLQYPTQKPEALLNRIVCSSSAPGDLVLDCFLGSGTTAAVAQKLGRRWIGCDINKGAIQTTVKRLRGIIAEQIQTARETAAQTRQGKLFDKETEGESQTPKPCAFGFTVWRVNDYDLAIQHNEAVNLACEHIGIQRTRSDSYFDGTLGKRLAKIVPFGHPLTPLDLEELRRELDSRPDEDRNIVLVCLGMELAAQGWIDDWNRLRKGESAVNKIDVVELRTDPKYGRFIKHEPASAKVKITRKKRGGEARIAVEVQDFISPTIVERLQAQAGLLAPKIDDWRAMVDCIYIDSAYRDAVLNVALADVPERKADFVSGAYELPAPEDETTVAVKIIDMLGEEVLVTKVV